MADKTDGRNDLNEMSDGRMVWTIFGETDGRNGMNEMADGRMAGQYSMRHGRNGMNEMSDSRMARQYSVGQMVRMV